MSVTIKSSNTSRYIEQSVKLSWLALILIILAAVFSPFFSKPVTNEMLTVLPEESVTRTQGYWRDLRE